MKFLKSLFTDEAGIIGGLYVVILVALGLVSTVVTLINFYKYIVKF